MEKRANVRNEGECDLPCSIKLRSINSASGVDCPERTVESKCLTSGCQCPGKLNSGGNDRNNSKGTYNENCRYHRCYCKRSPREQWSETLVDARLGKMNHCFNWPKYSQDLHAHGLKIDGVGAVKVQSEPSMKEEPRVSELSRGNEKGQEGRNADELCRVPDERLYGQNDAHVDNQVYSGEIQMHPTGFNGGNVCVQCIGPNDRYCGQTDANTDNQTTNETHKGAGDINRCFTCAQHRGQTDPWLVQTEMHINQCCGPEETTSSPESGRCRRASLECDVQEVPAQLNPHSGPHANSRPMQLVPNDSVEERKNEARDIVMDTGEKIRSSGLGKESIGSNSKEEKGVSNDGINAYVEVDRTQLIGARPGERRQGVHNNSVSPSQVPMSPYIPPKHPRKPYFIPYITLHNNSVSPSSVVKSHEVTTVKATTTPEKKNDDDDHHEESDDYGSLDVPLNMNQKQVAEESFTRFQEELAGRRQREAEERCQGGEEELQREAEERSQGGEEEFQREAEERSQGGEEDFQREAEERCQGEEFQREAEERCQGEEFQREAEERNQGGEEEFQREAEERSQGGEEDFQREAEERCQGEEFQREAEERSQGGEEEFQREAEERSNLGEVDNAEFMWLVDTGGGL